MGFIVGGLIHSYNMETSYNLESTLPRDWLQKSTTWISARKKLSAIEPRQRSWDYLSCVSATMQMKPSTGIKGFEKPDKAKSMCVERLL